MNDSVVLVTGGAGHLGRSVCRALLEEGARVAVPVYKTDAPGALDELRSRHRDRLHTFALDLTTERGAQLAADQVVEWADRLDAVVHLMGGYAGGSRLAETEVEAWDYMMSLNLKSAWLVARAAIPRMLETGGGPLVFVSSRSARRDRAGHGPYAIAKAALLPLVETIAEEYGAEGIRANAVLPGTIDTPGNRRRMPDADPADWTPPEEIARVILFLASEASRPINGSGIPVYGRS